MSRHRALTEPALPVAEPTSSILSTAGMRPRRIGGPSGSSLMTTGESSRVRTGPRTMKPAFPPLRKHSTSDHIDTVVLDPYADEDNDYDHDENHEIEEEEEGEEEPDGADEGERRQQQDITNGDGSSSSSRGSGSGRTLSEEPQAIDRQERLTLDGKQKLNEKQDLNRAEKGQAAGPASEGVRRRTISRTASGKTRKNPETREWKDNIVTFDSADDPMNPKNWPYKRKVLITMLMGLTTMSSTFASSVFSPALKYISQDYGISSEVAVLGISLFIVGFVPGPIIFAPLSEIYGRKWPTLAPLFISACFTAATATAENVQTIMITRFFAGVFASAPVTNIGGGLADMWDQKQRATAVVFYSLAVVAGPNLGPIVGAAAAQSSLGWRWTEYLSVILTMAVFVLDLFFFPETFAPSILNKKARELRWKTGRWELHSKSEMVPISIKTFMQKNLELPLKMIVREPMVLCITLFNSFAYGILYMLFSAIPIIYEENRGWNALVGTLPFIAVLLGSFTAAGINVLYSQKIFARKMDKHGIVDPEWRLPPMILGSIFFPVGFFLLGWTAHPSIHWFPSILGLYFIGVSFLLIFQGGLNYLLDAYTASAASAVAANTFMRSAFAGALPLVAQPMFHNLGIPWACTLLGCIAVLLAGIPVAFFKYGPRLRAMSRLARS